MPAGKACGASQRGAGRCRRQCQRRHVTHLGQSRATEPRQGLRRGTRSERHSDCHWRRRRARTGSLRPVHLQRAVAAVGSPRVGPRDAVAAGQSGEEVTAVREEKRLQPLASILHESFVEALAVGFSKTSVIIFACFFLSAHQNFVCICFSGCPTGQSSVVCQGLFCMYEFI